MRKTIYFIAIIALMLYSCAQDSHLIIEGYVYNNKTFEPLKDVNITLKTSTKRKTLSAKTDGNGYYSLGKVVIGEYIVILEKDSFMAELETIGLTGNYIVVNVLSKQTISTVTYMDKLTESAELPRYKF